MNRTIKFLFLNALLAGSTSLGMYNGGPLCEAACDGNVNSVKALLDSGIPVDAKATFGWTPLQTAVQCAGNKAVCQMLLEHKAQVNRRDINGTTALMIAAEQGHEQICQLLIDHNAQIDAQNRRGKTALQLIKRYHFCHNVRCTGRILVDGMLKSIKRSDAAVALLGIKKFRNAPDLKLIDPQVIKIIARYMREPFPYSKRKLIEHINRIETAYGDEKAAKAELLDYAQEQLNPDKQNNHCIIA